MGRIALELTNYQPAGGVCLKTETTPVGNRVSACFRWRAPSLPFLPVSGPLPVPLPTRAKPLNSPLVWQTIRETVAGLA